MSLVSFAKECIQTSWEGCGLDGGDIQDLALKHGLIKQVKFDPAIHLDPEGISEFGMDWFVYSEDLTSPIAWICDGKGDGWEEHNKITFDAEMAERRRADPRWTVRPLFAGEAL